MADQLLTAARGTMIPVNFRLHQYQLEPMRSQSNASAFSLASSCDSTGIDKQVLLGPKITCTAVTAPRPGLSKETLTVTSLPLILKFQSSYQRVCSDMRHHLSPPTWSEHTKILVLEHRLIACQQLSEAMIHVFALAGTAALWAVSRACRAARAGLRWCWRRCAHG